TGTTAFGLGARGVTSTGTQNYDGAVTVGPTAAALNLTGSTVTFGGTVDDATAGTDALTVTGNAVFDGVVGGGKALKSLHVTGTTNFAMAASAGTTTATQN